ncbi:MAG: FAD-binding domain-containing protein [Actinomycetota bacterium]
MTDPTCVPTPHVGREAAEEWVARHLGGLFSGEPVGSERFRGGQSWADAALDACDVAGYAWRRNEVLPESRRGASALSPYIRHGLLPLRRVWDHVGGGPAKDVSKFRDELLWQEFARHWYARLGARSRRATRAVLPSSGAVEAPWSREMACMEFVVGELERDGWLVNQTRMWLASDWTIRHDVDWREGEDHFFRHLLDGSRAANRLGWQWTSGVGSSKPYGFSRWQVNKRSPQLCRGCALRDDCPIEHWPDEPERVSIDRPPELRRSGPGDLSGPAEVVHDRPVDTVWLTAESLGDDDPALDAHPDAPVVFVFDRRLLTTLQLSAKRLVFLVEALAELAVGRQLDVHVGDPAEVVSGRAVAVTHAPVPGFARIAEAVRPAETHPWPWLAPPIDGNVASFSAWREQIRRPR